MPREDQQREKTEREGERETAGRDKHWWQSKVHESQRNQPWAQMSTSVNGMSGSADTHAKPRVNAQSEGVVFIS